MAESLILRGEQIKHLAAMSARVLAQPGGAMSRTGIMNKQQFARPFMSSIVIIGSAIILFSISAAAT